MHELGVERRRRLLYLLLSITSERLIEAFTLRETLELINAFVSLTNAILSRQIDFSWVLRH